jgi:hypothetical protein
MLPLIAYGIVPTSTAHAADVEISAEPGLDIFDPKDAKYDYRYGPSMILNEDGSLEVWFASPSGVLPDGFRNQIFVARSKSATGPFEKWNGSGWGGKPAPFITFQTPPKAWGVGEPTFTIKSDTLSISTAKRMTADAHVIYRTSKDGIHFSEPKVLRENIKPWCHNAGISSGPEGWIDPAKPVYLSYAFSNKPEVSWGIWHTWLNPVKITVTGNEAGEENP